MAIDLFKLKCSCLGERRDLFEILKSECSLGLIFQPGLFDRVHFLDPVWRVDCLAMYIAQIWRIVTLQ